MQIETRGQPATLHVVPSKDQILSPEINIRSESDIQSPQSLRAIATLSDVRGDVRFTPGGGVLFDTPISRAERDSIAQPIETPARLIDLPQDRYNLTYAQNSEFRAFIDGYTVAHARNGYRLVVIALQSAIRPAQLRLIADVAEVFGHSTIRLTAGVSIRLPNVPVALLRPLWSKLDAAGLLSVGARKLAA
ncbi:MAG: hypothetical protein GXP05_04165 [Alphaproteobacteria bacterium]|nr:hypothetical protein [Alphaproteobacteria bacterium]